MHFKISKCSIYDHPTCRQNCIIYPAFRIYTQESPALRFLNFWAQLKAKSNAIFLTAVVKLVLVQIKQPEGHTVDVLLCN